MSYGYAVRLDGRGWRAVESEDDCTEEETFSLEQPAVPDLPNPRIAQIDAEMMANDLKMIRPNSAISSGNEMDADRDRLAFLMSANEVLREERRILTGG